MNYTNEDILQKLNKRINYSEVARILELDLNTIASQVIDAPEDYMEFKVFFDYGEFDTTVNGQAPGEGQGFHVTPVLLSLIGGDYSTEKGPQIFQTQFRIEAFAFQKDMENLRTILEIYSSLNQGAVSEGVFANALTTSITDFPVFGDVSQYKGFDRVSGFLSWFLTFIYSGQLANEVEITIDGELLNILDFDIKRVRIGDSDHPNDELETSTLNISQVLVFTGFMIYDGSIASKKILRNIKNLDTELNKAFQLSIKYPTILENEEPEIDNYEVVVTEGDIKITQGSYLNITFSLALT